MLGRRGYEVKEYVHGQGGQGGLKLQDLIVRTLWMTTLQCNKHFFKKLIFYGIQTPETYFSRNQLLAG